MLLLFLLFYYYFYYIIITVIVILILLVLLKFFIIQLIKGRLYLANKMCFILLDAAVLYCVSRCINGINIILLFYYYFPCDYEMNNIEKSFKSL